MTDPVLLRNSDDPMRLERYLRLYERYGQLWDTPQVEAEFTVENFSWPFCSAVRKSDGIRGTLEFTASPRFYHTFIPD